MTKPKYRRPLNNYQLTILKTLYKFRFVTAQLITISQGSKSKRVILARLKVLEDQEYIAKHYPKSYKLLGQPARYYLTSKGIRALRDQPFADPNVLGRIYYDKDQTELHITHRLNVFRAYIYFKQNYPNTFDFFSRSELASFKYIPKGLADAYLKRLQLPSDDQLPSQKLSDLKAPEYLLSFYEPSLKNWQLKNSLSRYVKYAESEQWTKKTATTFPVILMACNEPKLAKSLEYLADQETENSWVKLQFVPLLIT